MLALAGALGTLKLCPALAEASSTNVAQPYFANEQRPVGDSGYNAWVENLQKGRLYSGDGRSHFLEFTVNRRSNGTTI
jgi:hypothetical protein